jgi:leucyl aminopeptidase
VPTLDVVTTPLTETEAALAVVGAFAPASGERSDPPELAPGAAAVADALGIDLVRELVAVDHDGTVGAVARIPTRGAIPAPTLLVVGLGKAADAGTLQLRRAAAAAANAAERVPSLVTTLHTALPRLGVAEAAQAVAEGVLLGAYRFGSYRSEARPFELERVLLTGVATPTADAATDGGTDADAGTDGGTDADTGTDGGTDADAVRAAVEVAEATAGAAILTRDLVNTPPQDKRPPALAARAAEAVEGLPIEVRILDEDALAEGGYGGILGVGRGSSEPPRLVELSYAPEGATTHVALVGKGITFDTGGISLKPSDAMETMKMDMAGAATVLAVVRAAAQLGLPVRLTGLLALAENMPSGSATRVSDVLTMRDGTTVEVINTDAEGRLVLGDALAHASELGPDAIVDVATLTGAAVVALGERIGVLMGSDDVLADALLAASRAAGEPLWPLPLATEEYGDRLEGAVADLKNSGTRAAGTIFAGLFLHRFVGEGIAWAHLDVAGVAWSNEPFGEVGKGGTGVPVRTLLAWLRGLAAAAAPGTGDA